MSAELHYKNDDFEVELDETAHICVQLQNELGVLENQYRELQAQVKYGLRDRYKVEE